MINVSSKIKKLFKKTGEIVESFSNKSVKPTTWALGFLGIMATRLFIDDFIVKTGKSGIFTITDIHDFFFFLITILLIWIFLSLILRLNTFNLSYLMLWVALMFICPPLIDMIKTRGSVYWTFYILDNPQGLWSNFITIFGNLPSGNVYFGSKIVFIVAIIMIAGLIYIKAKSWIKAILGAIMAYGIFFFMASLPSWITYFYYFFQGSMDISNIDSIKIIQFFGIPQKIFGFQDNNISHALIYNLNLIYFLFLLFLLLILFFLGSKKIFFAFLKNSRPPQLVYHTGLFFVGLGLGWLAYTENYYMNFFSFLSLLVLIASIWLGWEASVVFNDIYDYEIDKISNPDRPLQKKIFTIPEYSNFGIILFLLSIIGGLVVDVKFAILLIIYQFIAWTYSAPPFRLKKFPVIATFLSSVASLTVIFMGFTLFSGEMNVHGLSFRIILLVILGLTLSLPIKDIKDIEGDKKYSVWTVPVLLGEGKGKLAIAIGVFISFMLTVFLLNELDLFWWAVVFGGASFLVISNKKINPRSIYWWVLGIVGIYMIVMTLVVFL